MNLIRILLAVISVTILPMTVGTLFLPREDGHRPIFAWIYGQIFLWAGFLFTCVPMVLAGKEFPLVKQRYFWFCGACLALALPVFVIRRLKGKSGGEKKTGIPGKPLSRAAKIAWCAFSVLVLIQVACAIFLMYEDGDDAFYVAITTFSKEVQTLYRNIPYTGAYTGLELRHSLAPFPVWVAVLADVAGASGAATAHVGMPLLILGMTYGLFYLLGVALLGGEGEKKDWGIPVFMCFAALLVIFGGYSIYSAENFLIVRAGQGKAVLANVVIPALLYLTVILMQKLEKKEKTPFSLWVLIWATMTTGCLCSTLGSFLLCVFLGVVILCSLVVYRRWKLIFGTFVALLVPAVMAGLYVFRG